MGSCMNPPRLAIVTGFCRGQSLYKYIRTYKNEAVNLNSAKIIAQHIVQVNFNECLIVFRSNLKVHWNRVNMGRI